MPGILEILEKVKSEEDIKISVDQKVKNYLYLTEIIHELENLKKDLYTTLTKEQRYEIFQEVQKRFAIPEYLPVSDVAEILGISPQLVRRYCSEGKLEAIQTLEGSGKWRIEPFQFVDHANWSKYVEKRERILLQSSKLAEKMLQITSEEE
ncbi:helix-turn-helix domain-containing protein [Gottfriedia solisilvae]|uniref:helix-turn-helix domain-containing protein n=1 Tax=Gottfriedia solisilvae TaxID=1516104 RepID=UPI003D2EBACF